MKRDGHKINLTVHAIMTIALDFICLWGYLNFSVVQVFNQLRASLSCNDNMLLIILSRSIALCYYFGPFLQSIVLIGCVYFISKLDDTDSTSQDDEDEEDLGDTNSLKSLKRNKSIY